MRDHLVKVYLMLGITAATTSLGVLLQMRKILDLGILAAIVSLMLVLGLHFYRDNGKNFYKRVVMLYSFGFCSGQTIGPLLSYVAGINPSIIMTALFGTIITFISLSLAALYAERGKFLMLGGLLVSVINTMALLSLFNMFFQSFFIQMVSKLFLNISMFIAMHLIKIAFCHTILKSSIFNIIELYLI